MDKFLKMILPDLGVYFIATKVEGHNGLKHYPCNSTKEMAEKAFELNKTQTVYFACASFKASDYVDNSGNRRQRTSENARAAKAFWLDIDCGEAKAANGDGYKNKKEAAEALAQFCICLGLKLPTIVNSGGGIHAYFVLDQEIDKVTWQETARKLKSLTKSLNFLADDSRTSDIASLLRPIGTNNRKPDRKVKPVTLIHSADIFQWCEFKKAIEVAHRKYCSENFIESHNSQINDRIKYPETPENVERIKSALSNIDPNCDRTLWRNICFAIHDLGWNCSKDLALSWSKGDYL